MRNWQLLKGLSKEGHTHIQTAKKKISSNNLVPNLMSPIMGFLPDQGSKIIVLWLSSQFDYQIHVQCHCLTGHNKEEILPQIHSRQNAFAEQGLTFTFQSNAQFNIQCHFHFLMRRLQRRVSLGRMRLHKSQLGQLSLSRPTSRWDGFLPKIWSPKNLTRKRWNKDGAYLEHRFEF